MNIKEVKARIREQVWKRLEEQDIARFPRPVYGRIPNYQGAEEAARLVTNLDEFKNANIVKVNPDAPQRMVRYYTLISNKMLIMPAPRLRSGFLLLRSIMNPKDALRASTITGAFEYGRALDIDKRIKIDAIVLGSVAVSRSGARLGKGEGYAEIEYAVFRELGFVDSNTPVITTVHDLQIVDDIPVEEHDLPVDIIVTPKEIIRTNTDIAKPKGLIWDILDEDKIKKMPLLERLREIRG
ncbi:MAG: 5-formyltetrahydrofolate cyclo-ligase [Candidatus Nitrosothermus koennekii]|nr:MAG: 5-formyltetrahydrofolate cyclo-ligase [Candidatus Nitrosothermus koennekii]